MPWIAGVDGCRSGWFVVLHDADGGDVRGRVVPDVQFILELPEGPDVIAIDMIIGLPDRAERGGRACDRAARALLGRPRASSVFSPPTRAALRETDYRAALAANRAGERDAPGISIEAFHLFPKIREVDRAMTPALQERLYEGHPELSFYELNGRRAVRPGKRTAEGWAERMALLEAAGFADVRGSVKKFTGGGAQADDILDAFALCWTARRLAAGDAVRLPEPPPHDARGLRMEIWR